MTALFSTAYLPPIAYMATLARHDEALIEAKETFPKQTYRNRTMIMTADGVRTLSVPTVRGNHSRTEEVSIDYSSRWNTIHLRTIEAAYSASPYYLYYKDDLADILMQHHSSLLSLNTALLQWMMKKLKIECAIALTDDWQLPHSDSNDFRYTFSPKIAYPTHGHTPYYQVFADRIPFTPNLSTLDLLLNMGPDSPEYLKNIT